jgi:hypothetical protein
MISKRIKRVINEFRARDDRRKAENEKMEAHIAELEWAHIYHDTIKDKAWLKNLSVSPGRWAVNYSFLYILVRILSEYKPEKIVEFGLGESSKIVSSYLENELHDSSQLIVEQDQNWIKSFKSRFKLSKNSVIMHLLLEEKIIKGFPVKSYKDLNEKINRTFDLYIIDGPFGSENFSRYDICILTERINVNDEFIIIIDDYDREGEKETVIDLIDQLTTKGIKLYTGVYTGSKFQIIITTEKYRFATSV